MTMRRIGHVAIVLMLGAVSASANDSTATLGAGGLVLTQNADIRMASEDLFVSKDQIRVRYQFVNDAPQPISTEVAFPLPDADMEELSESMVGWATEKGDNVVDFKITVGGQPVAPLLERKAVAKGRDVTALLVRFGIPITPRADEVMNYLQKLPPAAKQELARYELVYNDPESVHPRWTVKNTYHWRQTFPRGPLTVEHTYKPIVGASFLTPESVGYVTKMFREEDFYKKVCIDDPTKAGIVSRLKTLRPGQGLMMQWNIDYVLTTGRNWKGPIGAFRLTLDKGRPDNVISFCMDGVKKTGPTTFVVERRDFEPDKDLSVLIFELARQ